MNIQQKVLNYLSKGDRYAIESPAQLAKIIIDFCTSVFDQDKVSAEFQFFDFFEHSVDEVSNSAQELFGEFGTYVAQSHRGEIEDHLDIEKHANLLVEIEDIRDELEILKQVLSDAKMIMQDIDNTWQIPAARSTNNQDRDNNALLDHSAVDGHLQQVESMLKRTAKPRQTFLYLIQFKQTQAGMLQAKATAKYTEQQVLQAEETARQGQTLMLFTVVTILFLPLSFMSAFFAVAIDAFPLDANGKLSLGYVLKYMLSISAGLSIPFMIIAFNLDRFGKWMGRVRVRLNFTAIMITLIPVSLGVLLPVIWTSSLAYSIKLAVTIAAVLGVLVCLVIAGIGKLVNVPPL
ncbi:hypothetical protein KJ359_012557 [Pestalotiopsis sp. 9143b]|nr:hypothetical protein KJ359_012557 [Pestalotiopsis sp. 9143b]